MDLYCIICTGLAMDLSDSIICNNICTQPMVVLQYGTMSYAFHSNIN